LQVDAMPGFEELSTHKVETAVAPALVKPSVLR
jgi:hypothetical protein